MVVRDGVKYACQACIKGHRSSKCTHSHRFLVEIKKKGRPASQCDHCRDLRRTRSVHGKCVCLGSRENDCSTTVGSEASLVRINSPVPGETSVRSSGCHAGAACRCCSTFSRRKSGAAPGQREESISVDHHFASSLNLAEGANKTTLVAGFNQGHAINFPPTLPSLSRDSWPCCSQVVCLDSGEALSKNDFGLYGLSAQPGILASSPAFALTGSTLFIPATQGTSSCFCGDSCACVGCPQHDPHGNKAPHSGYLPREMACRCGALMSEASPTVKTRKVLDENTPGRDEIKVDTGPLLNPPTSRDRVLATSHALPSFSDWWNTNLGGEIPGRSKAEASGAGTHITDSQAGNYAAQ